MKVTNSSFIQFFIFIFVIMCSFVYYENFQSEMIAVKSDIDDNEYQVRNLKDKQKAANTLAMLRRKMLLLVEKVHKLKGVQDNYCNNAIITLKERFKPEHMSESPSDAKYTSYSVNKGEKIFFCIRAKDSTNEIINLNTLLFVAIHEMAHVMTKSIGHTKEFWNNFRFLLREAVKSNVYQYQNFSSKPEKYCGMLITDSPYEPSRDDNLDLTLENTEKSCR